MIKNIINKSVLTILLLPSLLISSLVSAEDRTSISYGELSKSLTIERKQAITQENQIAPIVDQYIGKATNKTRAEIINAKDNKASKISSLAINRHRNNYADFAIYGASSLLEEDYDGDGFYQTFSVIFDADIYSYSSNPIGEVYALMYISKNGGPWTHYYTTDNFLIEGDTDVDEYEVVTTFLSGYSADHYDILIDLYQEGYSDIVASYSSDDSNALYALTLESADYDEPYIEVIETSNGGSLSVAILIFFIIIYSFRTITINKNS